MSDTTIARWIATGRLVRIHRGVYAYGHARLRPEGLRLAAVLACGEGAVLSHITAAVAWALIRSSSALLDVTAPPGAGRKLRGIRAHQSMLHPSECTVLDGVPITTVARTLVDLAGTASPSQLDTAIEQAERLALLDVRQIDAILARAPRRRGARRLREALIAHRPEHAWTRSRLERAALALVERHGLPRPAVNAFVAGHEVDLHWPAHGVVVELDTPAFHGTTAAFHRDRARDQHLTAAGLRVVRVTDRQLAGEPDRVAATLAALLRPRAGPRARGRG